MSYYGDIRLGDTVDVKFTSRNFSTGAPFTLGGTPVISAYVGNGTTEITAGITLTVDFDGRTGLNNVRVVASGGNGFASATNVQLVITTGTVNGVSVVGEVIGTFSIEARSAIMPTTAARTLDVSATGEAGIDWANIGSPTTAQNLSATTTNLVNTVTTYTGNTPQTGDSFARIGANGAGLTAIDLPNQTMDITGNITGNVSGSVGSVTGAVGSVTAGVTVSDKTGFSLSTAGILAIWHQLTSAIVTAGTIGKLIIDFLDATISSRSTYAGADTSGTTTLLTRIVGTLAAGTHNPQTGDAFARLGAPAGASVSADIVAVKTETASIQSDTNDLQTQVGTAGAGLTNINLPNQTMDIVGNITGNLSGSVGSVTGAVTVGAVNAAALADFFDTDSGTVYGSAVAGSVVKEIADNAGGGTPPTVGQIADAVWDEALAGHLGAGSTGEALNAAGAAGDPWTTNLPGAYGAGSAGKIIGDNINATISSRATQTSVDALNNLSSAQAQTAAAAALTAYDPPTRAEATSDKAEIITEVNANETKIDTLQTSVNDVPTNTELATALDPIPTANENADALLKRDWTAVSGEAARSVLNAMRFIRNRFSTISTPGSVDVFKEDDTTLAYSKPLTTDPSAQPITEG
jgi:hypothetical protein